MIDLSGTELSESDLSKTILNKAYFNGSNLSRVNLASAYLIDARLSMADLNGADLSRAILKGACFSGANLSGANLSESDLRGSNLSGTILAKANLTGADLTDSDLSMADLRGAYLVNANLSRAKLLTTQALSTDFSKAVFTGACLEDWHTNDTTNLDHVICDYVYLRQNQQERRPISGKFAPGEFTKLFQKVQETVDLIFRNGIDWNAFAYSFKRVEVENQSAQLDVQSIEKKGDEVLLVRVSVSSDADKSKIHSEFMQGYEIAHKALEAQYQARLEDKDKVINHLFSTINQISGTPKKVSNYYLNHSEIAGGLVDAETVQSQQIGGDIHNQ
jgi:hypothetical protein